MDNKYGLGSAKVAQVKHDKNHEDVVVHPTECKSCGSNELSLSPTMQDHLCSACGEWQNDVPQGYSTGRTSDY